jgi:transposase
MDKKPKQSINIPAEVLGLSDVAIDKVTTDLAARKITIRVRSTKDEILCRECNQPTNPHGRGRLLRLRHLPILGKETTIEIIPRRGRCPDCKGGPTTTQRLDWYDTNSKFTRPYEQHLLFELINSTVADISRKEDVDYHALEALIDKYIEEEIDFNTIDDIGILGIDDISLKKGYRDFVTIVSYRCNDEVRLLAVLDGRERVIVERFLRKIPERLKHTVRAVCCDLYEGYINASKAVFGHTVPVVADRFHVRKLYSKGLISLRKSELKRLKKSMSESDYKNLKPAISVLRKQKDYFTDDEKSVVEPLFNLSPKLKLAYQLSHKLTAVFNSHLKPAEAKALFIEWIACVSASKVKCFNRFIKTLNKHMDIIANYFVARNNSGFVEGFNNKIKVLKRRCYGLSHVTRLFQRLMLDLVGFERFNPSMA